MQYVVTRDTTDGRLQGTDWPGARWTRFDDRTLIWGHDLGPAAREPRAGGDFPERVTPVRGGHLGLVIQVGRAFQDAYPDVRVVLDKGRYLVVDLGETSPAPDDTCWTVRPLTADSTVLARTRATPGASTLWILPLVEAVSATSLEAALGRLVDLPTRHSASDQFGIAAEWAAEELRRRRYVLGLEAVTLPDGTRSSNVVADRLGSGPTPRDLVVVTAHLDSINSAGGPSADAPGADDNASGAAGLLEIANVFADQPTVHDLRLILFGGEEQGLHGSHQHVAGQSASDRARTRAVVNMDMIGTLNTAEPTVLIEGAPVSQALMADLASAAATYTSLSVQTSLTPFASDHVPFIRAGMPAVLTIEGADRANANVHTADDIIDHIHEALALEILRMNVATIALYLGHNDIQRPHQRLTG